MRCYVFDKKSEAIKAEKAISDLAGCPFNDGVNSKSKKPVVNPNRKKPHKRPKQGTTNWANIRPRKDGKFYFLIPEGTKATGRFANIPLLDTNKHDYIIDVYTPEWWPEKEVIQTLGNN